MKRIFASYWTIGSLFVLLVLVHGAWFLRWEPTKRGEVLAAFGASLTILGLLIAARGFIEDGITRTVDRNAPTPGYGAYAPSDPAELLRQYNAFPEERAAARRAVIAERLVAVVVVGVGSFLNGYGTPLIRWLGLDAGP